MLLAMPYSILTALGINMDKNKEVYYTYLITLIPVIIILLLIYIYIIYYSYKKQKIIAEKISFVNKNINQKEYTRVGPRPNFHVAFYPQLGLNIESCPIKFYAKCDGDDTKIVNIFINLYDDYIFFQSIKKKNFEKFYMLIEETEPEDDFS